jgi:hypothetical protein
MIGWSAGDDRFVLLGRHFGQSTNDCDHVPDELIIMGLPPRWHGTQFHAVLNRPELLGCRLVLTTRQLGRLRIETLAHLGLFKTWPKVTAGAHLGVQASTGRNPRRAVQIGWHNDVSGVVLDRAVAQLLKGHVDWLIVRSIRTDIVQPSEDERPCKCRDRQRED